MKPQADDILEYALTYGREKAAEKFNVPLEQVWQIVNDFDIETGNLCPCEKAKSKGIFTMCFMCEGKPILRF